MRIAIDTNVLVYAEGFNGPEHKQVIRSVLGRLKADDVVIPVQVLGELFNVLVKKAKWSTMAARTSMLTWSDTFSIAPTSPRILLAAADLAADHRLGIWDSVILACGADSGCRLLLSEDMQDGFTWNGITVANPFASRRHPLLEAALATTH